jgi:hypothetical protein
MHLKGEELVDIAEGTRPESSAPHLGDCESCRVQLRELRAMMSAAQEVHVPEPSPLFWDHLSSRVHEAVAAEGAPRPAWLTTWRNGPARAGHDLFGGVLGSVCVVALAALLIAVALKPRTPSPIPATPPATAVADAPAIELLRDITSDEDVSLTLVANLTDHVDLDTVREAGLATRGSAEDAITHMSESELRELGRLLKEELARPGA